MIKIDQEMANLYLYLLALTKSVLGAELETIVTDGAAQQDFITVNINTNFGSKSTIDAYFGSKM